MARLLSVASRRAALDSKFLQHYLFRELAVKRRRRMGGLLLPSRQSMWQPLGNLRRQRTHAVIRAHMLADGLQPLQNALPLCPIELTQVRTKPLNERVFEHRLAVCFRHEETVQSHTQRLGNLLQRSETRRHLSALDP